MEAVFLKLVNMSISASWVVLAVVVLRFALKKAPKAVRCVLWALVAVRLLCPVSIQSALSLIPGDETVSQEVLTSNSFTVDAGSQTVNVPANENLGSRYYEDYEPSAVPADNGINVMHILSIVWLCGAAALLGYGIVSYLRLKKKVSVSVKLRDNIYLCDYVPSPFILGVFRSKIYLPSDLEEERMVYVIAHENAHIKRRDNLIKPVGFILLTVYWFNPVIWLAYILLCRDIELACDERVIRDMGAEDKRAYSEALLSCSVPRKMILSCPVAFGEVGVKERVKSVLNYKKPAFWVLVIAVAACVVAAVCLLTDPVGLKIDLREDEIESASVYDLRLDSEMLVRELNAAQISELISRLSGIKGAKRDSSLGGMTALYQLSIELDNNSYIYVNGYSDDGDEAGIYYEGSYYKVTDSEFLQYLSNICSGGDVTEAENITEPNEADVNATIDEFLKGLTGDDIGDVEWVVSGVERPNKYEVAEMINAAMDNIVEPENPDSIPIWSTRIYIGDENVKWRSGDDFLRLSAGLEENLVEITGGSNLPEGTVYVEDAVLYQLLRTMNDTPDVEIDESIYSKYSHEIDTFLAEVWDYGDIVTAHNELTGLRLVESSSSLNANVYLVSSVMIVESEEKAYVILAGGEYLDSGLRVHGAKDQPYLVTVDGEAIGFLDYDILYDAYGNSVLDGFESKDALIAVVRRYSLLQFGDALTADELAWFNEWCASTETTEDGGTTSTTVSCFFTSYYNDVRDLDFGEFLSYAPFSGGRVDEEEFEALKQDPQFGFESVQSLDDMIVPIHKFPSENINAVLMEYAGITLSDLNTDGVLYSAEYDAYYNFTSDFGPGAFSCTHGVRDGNIVTLYAYYGGGDIKTLKLKEVNGGYQILSHQYFAGWGNN